MSKISDVVAPEIVSGSTIIESAETKSHIYIIANVMKLLYDSRNVLWISKKIFSILQFFGWNVQSLVKKKIKDKKVLYIVFLKKNDWIYLQCS